LLRAALAARPLSPLAAAPWRLLAGPHLPMADFAALGAALPPGVVLERFRPDFPAMLSRCVLSISQGGYNTTLDLLRARPRAIVVPFAAVGETEQTLRSTLLARRGAFRLLDEGELDGENLAAAIAARMAEAAPLSMTMQREGAAASARIVAEIAVGNSAARV
jgi:predicted glycosyltransferase